MTLTMTVCFSVTINVGPGIRPFIAMYGLNVFPSTVAASACFVCIAIVGYDLAGIIDVVDGPAHGFYAATLHRIFSERLNVKHLQAELASVGCLVAAARSGGIVTRDAVNHLRAGEVEHSKQSGNL